MSRVPQLHDDVCIEIRFLPTLEEWADVEMREMEGVESVQRTDEAVTVHYRIGGNCSGIWNLGSFLRDLDEVFTDLNIDPMEFTVNVTAKEPGHAK